jgi:hypothetical protein
MSTGFDLRGESPFPEAGEGVSLLFTWSDQLALQKKYGEDWYTLADVRCLKLDVEFIGECVKLGARKDGKRWTVALDDIAAAMEAVALAVLNGIFMSTRGKDFATVAKEAKAARDKAKDDESKGDGPLES